MFVTDVLVDEDPELIHPGLDTMEPGPVLAAFLSAIDMSRVSAHDQIIVLRANQRMASHYQAQIYRDMAGVSDHMTEIDDDQQLANESAAAEIRAALRLTRRAADTELGFALDLRQRLPMVWNALAAGRIDLRRAKAIAYGTGHLDRSAARKVVDRILTDAPGLTTGQLAARLRRLCIEADPDAAAQRYEHAVEDRRVVTQPSEWGTASLFAIDLPPHRVAAVMNRINHLAWNLRSKTETRTMDQLRADILMDLLEGNAHSGKGGKGVIDLHVGLEALTRLTDTPGELAGYGPVIADIARQVAEQQLDAEWRFTITDSDTSRPIGNGITRYRPNASQRREAQARNPVCVFPGCRMPATDSDLDHRIPWIDSKATRVDQLNPLCRHDHVIRHHAGWVYEPLPNGDYLWTTRLGHTYTTSGQPP
ncbi:MAG: DUF222 domain-containing protein [Actinomycetota bacterium]|nr:DUF222 domain-containing protein [Actinomycetota bacterium]